MTDKKSQTASGNKGNTGLSKHRRSGKTPKSPKTRFHMKLEAEKNDRKAKPSTCTAKTVKELLNGR